MQSLANIKSISYLKSHAAQISEDLELNGNPFIITQNGEASMVIESIKQFQEKEELLAALKIIALGEKDRLQNKDSPGRISRTTSCCPSKPQIMAVIILPDAQEDLPSLQEYMLDKWGEAEWLKAEDEIFDKLEKDQCRDLPRRCCQRVGVRWHR